MTWDPLHFLALFFADESSGRFYNVTICVDQANFPLANALATGHDTLEKAARCYIRYKLYDRGDHQIYCSPVTLNIC